jgi:hypothetical protein
MIKHLKYMLLAAITMIAATGCQEDWEDAFSKDPVAPSLLNNGTILMTENTMNEDVTWAWSGARFVTGDVTYSLYAEYNGESKQVGSDTKNLTVSISKNEFKSLVAGFSGVPQNASFDLNFYVIAKTADGSYTSDKQLVTVYSYGDAVSAVAEPTVTSIVLDINNPSEEVELLTWEPARLKYNEAITYNVYMSYDGTRAAGDMVEVAKDLTTTSCSKTVDEWNELVVSTGAPEAAEATVQLQVFAYSESYPDGVPSSPVDVTITTYTATYPDALYLPGSYQAVTVWDPETAPTILQSTSTKGLFAGFVDLTTADGSDAQFKFCPEPAWGFDFGGSDITVDNSLGFNIVSGATVGDGNITVPSGFYHITVNKKFNTLEMVQVNSVGMIGGFNSWASDLEMTYDADAKTYSAVGTFTKGDAFKFRVNSDWTYSIGTNGVLATSGDNFEFTQSDGEYKVVLNVSQAPYTVKFYSTSYPEKLYIPGAYQGWAIANAPTLQGDGQGHYEGALNLVGTDDSGNCDWKFSPNPAWGEDFAGTITLDENGNGTGTYGGTGNITVPNGYYYITVDMTNGTFSLLKITEVGLIGGFNSWGGDEDFTFDADTNTWSLTTALTANDEFKVRFNAGWDYNRGLEGDGAAVVSNNATTTVVQNGQNMKVAEDGTYTITLNLSTNPNTILIKKQ